MATLINATLLLLASTVALVPLLWRKQSSWLDPMVLFGGTVFVWGFGKYLFLTFSKPVDGLPAWAIAADLQNGVLAISLFCLAAIVAYVATRSAAGAPKPVAAQATLDMRIIYFASMILTLISLSAFVAILYSPDIAISWDAISAKRFLDSDLGPAARVGSIEYLLYKATLMARVPLYAILVGVLLRRKAHALDTVLLTVNFLCIFVVAFIFSNRFNLLLGFVDMAAIAAVFVRRIISPRFVLLGLGVFAAMILASELRMGEGRDRSVLEHIYEGRYFADVERTDKVIDYYETAEHLHGKTLYGWLFIALPSSYGDGGEAFLNMGWNIGYHVFGLKMSGVPPGFIGELYMNFGSMGILIGGLLFGIVSAYVAMRLHDRSKISWLAVLLALIAIRVGLVLFNGNLGTAMIKIALEALPAAFLIWVATRSWVSRRARIGSAQYSEAQGH